LAPDHTESISQKQEKSFQEKTGHTETISQKQEKKVSKKKLVTLKASHRN
jgi:hypothetical protein